MDRTVLSFPLTNNWRRTKRWPRLLYAPTAINKNRECTPWIAERATSFVLLRGKELVWFLHRPLHHGWSFIASSQCFLCRQCRSRSAIRSHFFFFLFLTFVVCTTNCHLDLIFKPFVLDCLFLSNKVMLRWLVRYSRLLCLCQIVGKCKQHLKLRNLKDERM